MPRPECDKLQNAKGGLSSTRHKLVNYIAVGINDIILPQLLDNIKS